MTDVCPIQETRNKLAYITYYLDFPDAYILILYYWKYEELGQICLDLERKIESI